MNVAGEIQLPLRQCSKSSTECFSPSPAQRGVAGTQISKTVHLNCTRECFERHSVNFLHLCKIVWGGLAWHPLAGLLLHGAPLPVTQVMHP